MNGFPWILVAVGAGIGLLAVLAVWYTRKGERKHTPDYYTFFIMGVMFIPLGFVLENPGIWGMGVIFLITGLLHKDEWKHREAPESMSPERKKAMVLIPIGLTALIALGVLVGFLAAR